MSEYTVVESGRTVTHFSFDARTHYAVEENYELNIACGLAFDLGRSLALVETMQERDAVMDAALSGATEAECPALAVELSRLREVERASYLRRYSLPAVAVWRRFPSVSDLVADVFPADRVRDVAGLGDPEGAAPRFVGFDALPPKGAT